MLYAGNQGIGLAIAEILAKQGLHTVLTARRPDAGQEAVDTLKKNNSDARITFHPLDIRQGLQSSRPAALGSCEGVLPVAICSALNCDTLLLLTSSCTSVA